MTAEQEIRQALIGLGFELVKSDLYGKVTEIFELFVFLNEGLVVTAMLYSGKTVYTKKQVFIELECPYKLFIEDVIMKAVSEVSMAYIKDNGVVAKTKNRS